MSAAKHTPGPWRLNEIGNVESEAVHNIASVFQSAIQDNWAGSDFSTISHCNANARLIAAAPELLDALQMFLDDYESSEGDAQSCARVARAAIAKATGEQA